MFDLLTEQELTDLGVLTELCKRIGDVKTLEEF